MSKHSYALVPLRLAIGLGFVMHGQAKLARGPEYFEAVVGALGMPRVAAWAVIALELAGGLLVVAGAYLRYISIPLASIVIVAIVGVHWQYGFSSIKLIELTAAGARFGPPGYELGLIYVAALAALALAEPTPYSIDRWRATQTVR